MKHVFGPVLSRRLGRSLGVDLVPPKTCSLNCVYCECGATTDLTLERRVYYPTEEVLAEARPVIRRLGDRLDWVTLSGSGEPTLAANMGEVIAGLKAAGARRVAVLTNGTLLDRPDVVQELQLVDRLCPSLDAVDAAAFQAVGRPHPDLDLDRVLEGLRTLRDRFHGRIHLEVLLVKGLNDGPEAIQGLIRELRLIRPDVVELGTVARPGTESWIEALEPEELTRIAALLPGPVELVAYRGATLGPAVPGSVEEQVRGLVSRRPATTEQIATGLGLRRTEVAKVLDQLVTRGTIRSLRRDGQVFFAGTRAEGGQQ